MIPVRCECYRRFQTCESVEKVLHEKMRNKLLLPLLRRSANNEVKRIRTTTTRLRTMKLEKNTKNRIIWEIEGNKKKKMQQ